ncbi:MAG TPA: hypothetical protein VK921_17910 [Anditalea sp.]|nr:hypothetical protein [Anditalea sp.]
MVGIACPDFESGESSMVATIATVAFQYVRISSCLTAVRQALFHR